MPDNTLTLEDFENDKLLQDDFVNLGRTNPQLANSLLSTLLTTGSINQDVFLQQATGTITSTGPPSAGEMMLGEGARGPEEAAFGATFPHVGTGGQLFEPRPVDVAAGVAGVGVTSVTGNPYLGALAAGAAGGLEQLTEGKTKKEALIEGAWQTLFQAVDIIPVKGVMGGISKTPVIGQAAKVGPEERIAMEQLKRVGGHLTLDQATTGALTDKVVTEMERAFGASDFLRKRVQPKWLRDLATKTIQDIAPDQVVAQQASEAFLSDLSEGARSAVSPLTKGEVGRLFAGAWDIAEKAGRRIRDEKFGAIWNKTRRSGVTVNTESIIDAMGLQQIVDPLGNLKLSKPQLLKAAAQKFGDNAIGRLASDLDTAVSTFGIEVPPDELWNMFRTRLSEEISVAGSKTPGQRRLLELRGKVDEVFFPAIDKAGARREYDEAIRFLDNFNDISKDKFVMAMERSAMEAQPEKVSEMIFRQGEGGVSNAELINKVKKILLNPPAGIPPSPAVWDEIVARRFRNRIEGGVIDTIANGGPNQFLDRSPGAKILGLDNEAYEAVIQSSHRKVLDDFAITIERVGRDPKAGMVVQLVQAGTLSGLAVWGIAKALGDESTAKFQSGMGATALVILGGPPILSKLFQSEGFVRMMTEGLTTPMSSISTATSISTRLVQDYIKMAVESGTNVFLDAAGFPQIRPAIKDVNKDGTISAPQQPSK